MADTSLYLGNVNVSIEQNTAGKMKELEVVELGELDQRQDKEKPPRRIIHFSSGETMEEYSTDEEEEEEEEKKAERKDLLASQVDAVRSKMTWGPYFWFHMWRAATSTISACDYLGERMANLFGITSAKYQYAIDEYYRMKKEREEEKEEARLSEEAERSLDRPNPQEERGTSGKDAASQATYQIHDEKEARSSTIIVPAIVTAT
ncbi:protein FAM177A1-like isoform 1-T1 [Synchiropus picturatus]